jgi:hypothetical protein
MEAAYSSESLVPIYQIRPHKAQNIVFLERQVYVCK